MPGNSRRQGAVRKTPKTGAGFGSGGKNRNKLAGKGPTPKAEDRTYHPAARAKKKGKATGQASDPSAPVADSTPAASASKASSQQRTSGAQRSTGRSGKPHQRGAKSNQPYRSPSRPMGELIAGRNPVVEALRAGVPATTLYAAGRIDLDGRVREAIGLATTAGIPLLEVTRPELERMVGDQVHQGLALAVPPYTYAHPDDLLVAAAQQGSQPLIVALDSVTDPRNAGAIIRSAAAFGAHGVVVASRRAAGVTTAVWKSSAGALARLPVAQASNLVQALTSYQRQGLFVVGLDAAAEHEVAQLASASVGAGPLVLVVGAEDKGLSHLVAQTCDQRVAIAMDAATESLNASVAASVALYEIAKARR